MKAWRLFAGSLVLGSSLSLTLPARTGMHQHPQAETKEKTVKDPVCGMNVLPSKSFKAVYKKNSYYFCSAAEKAKFEKAPERYLKKGE
jgi:YHS domain-containing protein